MASWAPPAALLVYLLSTGPVHDFQHRRIADPELEELQKKAQVLLSILWAAIGGASSPPACCDARPRRAASA